MIPRLLRDPNQPSQILETAAGAGVHTEYFASKWLEEVVAAAEGDDSKDSQQQQQQQESKPPPFVWYPTDPSEEALESIRARMEDETNNNFGGVLAPPLKLTLGSSGILKEESSESIHHKDPLDLVLSINMIHISPWEATLGLMKVAGKNLRDDGNGYLYCYGPYKQDGVVVPSNESFDRSLKSRDPGWGVRDLKEVVKAAEMEGFELVEKIDMPANNTSLIFRRIRKTKEN